MFGSLIPTRKEKWISERYVSVYAKTVDGFTSTTVSSSGISNPKFMGQVQGRVYLYKSGATPNGSFLLQESLYDGRSSELWKPYACNISQPWSVTISNDFTKVLMIHNNGSSPAIREFDLTAFPVTSSEVATVSNASEYNSEVFYSSTGDWRVLLHNPVAFYGGPTNTVAIGKDGIYNNYSYNSSQYKTIPGQQVTLINESYRPMVYVAETRTQDADADLPGGDNSIVVIGSYNGDTNSWSYALPYTTTAGTTLGTPKIQSIKGGPNGVVAVVIANRYNFFDGETVKFQSPVDTIAILINKAGQQVGGVITLPYTFDPGTLFPPEYPAFWPPQSETPGASLSYSDAGIWQAVYRTSENSPHQSKITRKNLATQSVVDVDWQNGSTSIPSGFIIG